MFREKPTKLLRTSESMVRKDEFDMLGGFLRTSFPFGIIILGGGFKYFLFSPLLVPREMIQSE